MLKWIGPVGGVTCVAVMMVGVALGQGGMGGPGGGDMGGPGGSGGPQNPNRRSAPADYYRGSTPPPSQAVLTPHCGQYLKTKSHFYELVFTMVQIRLYAFDSAMKPQSARDVRVQVSFQVPDEKEVLKLPFQYVATPAGGADQDYLAVNFDFSQFHDKSVPMAIEFANASDKGTASFSPIFSPASVRPYVAQVLANESDRPNVTRQAVCPVCGAALGSKGVVVKVLVAEWPLYLCSKECMTKVRRTPEKFQPQPAVPPPNR